MLSIYNEIIKKLYFYMVAAIAKKNAPHKEIENKIRFLYICGYFEKNCSCLLVSAALARKLGNSKENFLFC